MFWCAQSTILFYGFHIVYSLRVISSRILIGIYRNGSDATAAPAKCTTEGTLDMGTKSQDHRATRLAKVTKLEFASFLEIELEKCKNLKN